MRRKVWVTRTWNKAYCRAEDWEFNPDIPMPALLEGIVDSESPLFMYFSEIWFLQIGSIEYKRNHPWLKRGIGWHETKQEAERFLEWEKNYSSPGTPVDLRTEEEKRARQVKDWFESLVAKEMYEMEQSLSYSLEHAKISAPKTLPRGWGPVKQV